MKGQLIRAQTTKVKEYLVNANKGGSTLAAPVPDLAPSGIVYG